MPSVSAESIACLKLSAALVKSIGMPQPVWKHQPTQVPLQESRHNIAHRFGLQPEDQQKQRIQTPFAERVRD
jgi:hypothetical protein